MTSARGSAQEAGKTAVDWVTSGRVRLLGTAAGALVVLTLFCLLVGGVLFNVLAGVFLLVGAAAGLVAAMTWLAGRRGDTDEQDLWDHDASAADRPEDVLRGFAGFHE